MLQWPCAPAAWARAGTHPLWKCCKLFLCINNYSKMLSKRIIYSLFSQPVVSFWAPPLDCAGDFRVQTPNLSTPRKKILQVPVNHSINCGFIQRINTKPLMRWYASKRRKEESSDCVWKSRLTEPYLWCCQAVRSRPFDPQQRRPDGRTACDGDVERRAGCC